MALIFAYAAEHEVSHGPTSIGTKHATGFGPPFADVVCLRPI